MKFITILLISLVLVGCQTTQKAEAENTPNLPKEGEPLLKSEDINPFEDRDIPDGTIITSSKPIICGRIDTILARMEKRFGETPILAGKVAAVTPGKGESQVMSVLTYNAKTGSYTFLEQMPAEERLMCILSSGHGKLNKNLVEGTSL